MKRKSKVYGVGTNDADYAVQLKRWIVEDDKKKQVGLWICPFYQKWKSVLERCYSKRWHARFPTYEECTVDDSWKIFSNFKTWMEQQDWEGKHLDKDLLFEGNKIYGPDACVFIDPVVNLFLHKKTYKKTDWKVGVDLHKGKIRARGMNEFGRNIHLGYYKTEASAHNAYLQNKANVARILADRQTDVRVAEALVRRYCTDIPKPDIEFKE